MSRRTIALLAAAGVSLGCPADSNRDDTGTTAPPMTSSAGATTSVATEGGADDSGTEDAATTTPLENACADVSECTLASDCCTCEAVLRGTEPPACDAECDRPLCDVWGIEELLCSHSCLIRLVECDAAMVTCADPPPTCDAGFMPSLDERCWSGRCVPAELCRPM